MTEADLTVDLPAALRGALSTVDHTEIRGSRGAVLLLLGYTCDATASDLVALDIADLEATDDGLLVKIYRQDLKRHDVVALSRRADSTTCAVVATQRLLASLDAAGRTAGPLFVRTNSRGWVTEPATRNGRPIYDPTGRLSAGAAANIVIRIGRAAGIEFSSAWISHSLHHVLAAAVAAE